MRSGSTYYMDVKLHKTAKYTLAEGVKDVKMVWGQGQHYRNKPFENQHLNNVTASYAGSIFGQPTQWTGSIEGNMGNGPDKFAANICDPAFAPYTPPYYYGDAIARLAFSPHKYMDLLEDESRNFTLDEILAGCSVETTFTSSAQELNRAMDAQFPAAINRMNLSESISLFGKTRLKETEFDPVTGQPIVIKDSTDSGLDIWTIASKFETPTLNVHGHKPASFGDIYGNNITGEGSTDARLANAPMPKCIWSAYGEIPEKDQGLFLQLQDSYPNKVQADDALTGSLLGVCGFKSDNKRGGEGADKKIISEAVVAVPFVGKAGKRKFFTINLDDASAFVKQHLSKLVKYNLPPHMDFNTNDTIKPYAAYVFEFKHELDQDDLVRIWNNTLPKIGYTAEKEEVTVSHPLAPGEFFDGKKIPDETRWMVFKVKQRAEKSYYAVTDDSTDDSRYKFDFKFGKDKTPDYSYNWPYDFFSLVELAKIDAEVEFVKDPTLMGNLKFMQQMQQQVTASTTYQSMGTLPPTGSTTY